MIRFIEVAKRRSGSGDSDLVRLRNGRLMSK